MKFKRHFETKAQIDLIPMIDVVFLLILFFLVSTTFALLPGITLNLPKAQTAESVHSNGITISVNSSGSIWVNDIPVENINQLEFALLSQAAKFTDGAALEEVPINLEADELVTNGTIVRILDALRKTGFRAINLRSRTYE